MSNPGDIVLDAFCGCGTALVAAQQLGRRWVGIDISPTSVSVMGQRLEDVCGMRLAPPDMSAEEVARSWNASPVGQASAPASGGGSQAGTPAPPGAAATGDRAGTGARPYYRFSNLPRSAEQLRALPGFEFENWAVLQLGEVLRSGGHAAWAQTNRSKVGDLGLDGRIYLADKVSLPVKHGDLPLMAASGISGEKQNYLPIQVKNTDKVGRPEIDKFAHALQRDGRKQGFFIGWEFSKDADKEIDRLRGLGGEDARVIFPVRVQRLIAEDFGRELLGLLG